MLTSPGAYEGDRGVADRLYGARGGGYRGRGEGAFDATMGAPTTETITGMPISTGAAKSCTPPRVPGAAKKDDDELELPVGGRTEERGKRLYVVWTLQSSTFM